MVISATIAAKNRPSVLTVIEELEDFGGEAAFGVSLVGGELEADCAVEFLATAGSGGSTTSAVLRSGGSATGSASNRKPGCTGCIAYGDPLVVQEDPETS